MKNTLSLKKDIWKYLPLRFRFLWLFLKDMRKNKNNTLSLKYKIEAFLAGFYLTTFLTLGLANKDKSLYVSDLHNLKIISINGKRSIILDDKLLFEMLLKNIAGVPNNFSLITKGKVISIDNNVIISSADDIWEYCKKTELRLVLKPLAGSGGKGIMIIEVKEDKFVINNKVMQNKDFENLIIGLDDYLVSVFLEQGSYTANFFSGSVNTIRIMTIINPINYKPSVVGAALRIGTSKSAPVDNIARGGLFSRVDLKTGMLSEAATLPNLQDSNNEVKWFKRHPDTGEQIVGSVIPDWQNILDMVLRNASIIPFIPYIGWDVCICEDKMVILEANSGPGTDIMQVHAPLLKNKDFKDILQHYKVY